MAPRSSQVVSFPRITKDKSGQSCLQNAHLHRETPESLRSSDIPAAHPKRFFRHSQQISSQFLILHFPMDG